MPIALHVERHRLRVRHRRDRRPASSATGSRPGEYATCRTPTSTSRSTGAQLAAADGRLSVKFARADGGSDLSSTRCGSSRSITRATRTSTRTSTSPRSPLRRRRSLRHARRAAAAGRVGREGDATCCRRCARATAATSRASAAPPFKGFAALHALELDLGRAARRRARAPDHARLHRLLHRDVGVRRDQAGVTAIVPYLEAQLPDGSWKRVSDDIGFPAGLRRTMTADLTGKLPPGTRRIRIWTNLKVYWDQVLDRHDARRAVPSRGTRCRSWTRRSPTAASPASSPARRRRT